MTHTDSRTPAPVATLQAADRARFHRLARERAQALRAQAGAEVLASLRATWRNWRGRSVAAHPGLEG